MLVEISPYDLTRGRITYRERNAGGNSRPSGSKQGNGFYLVTLEQPEGHQCLCRAAGKLTKFRIKLLAGDKVLVEISPYDLTRGRITYRERNAGGNSKPPGS